MATRDSTHAPQPEAEHRLNIALLRAVVCDGSDLFHRADSSRWTNSKCGRDSLNRVTTRQVPRAGIELHRLGQALHLIVRHRALSQAELEDPAPQGSREMLIGHHQAHIPDHSVSTL